jgi:hypothetical protein
MSAVDVLGFWFPLSGVFVLGLLWLLLRDTLRTPPGGGEEGGTGGGSDRVPRPPWTWNRRIPRPGGRTRRRQRMRTRT